MLENRDAMLARGRELIGQGLGHMWDVGMIDSMCVSEVYDQERELVQQRGHCSDRCRCQLIEHSHGYLVCPTRISRARRPGSSESLRCGVSDVLVDNT